MPTDSQIVKTSLRLPRHIHADLERGAQHDGVTLSAEMIFRLQHDPRDNYARSILAEIQRRDDMVGEGLRKQIAALWNALDRANDTLEKVSSAMSQVAPGTAAAALKNEVEFARELVNALSAYR